ncbi:AI-2E family transporter [Piscinibacter koreensis]|uniref:AI-2E family transporter n=1 Tax=Piscinibacter koreensis TaxID=2742824 RepID=A0A7Y6TXG2_9BURK|nr:AI-2E family transporter [Schlegelella koreensis]NUZ07011.1 AI-2E family transporter [Schlegelella koreensis]
MDADAADGEAAKPATESRPQVRSAGFAALALLGVGLCVAVVFPLLAPILWAMVLAIVVRPLHRRLEARIERPWLAAALATVLVALLVALPFALVASELLIESADALERLRGGEATRMWQESLAKHPQLASLVENVNRRFDVKAILGDLTGGAARVLRSVLTGSVAAVTGWLIMVFILFYFLRDRVRVLATVERFLPLTKPESRELFDVTADTVHATFWGTMGVAVLQGVLGGLAFWWLDLPAPVLWGAVMGVLSVLPVLGAAIVWLPVAGFLAMQGRWCDAAMLAAFGTIVIGLADNLVYPLVVKDRIRLHAVPVFVSVLGGLVLLGASGIILGPLLLAVTDALVKMWRRRMTSPEPVDAPKPVEERQR